nr:PREDICTED: uncharacterized protein LOC105672411 [Linepithema humile]
MISNQLIIRLEKDKSRKKKRGEWDPPCDCVEIQRPTSKSGPRIINADCDDRIVFRVQSNFQLNGKENSVYKAQTIAYKVGSCKDEGDSHECKTITVYPQFTTGSQEVYSDHVTEGNQNIFLLRVKKKPESSEQKARNVELELRTPKPPTPPLALVSAVSSPQPVVDLNAKVVEKPDEITSITAEKLTKQPTKELKHKKKKKKKKE